MHFLNRIMLERYVSNLLNQVWAVTHKLPILLLLALENITITFHNVTQSYVYIPALCRIIHFLIFTKTDKEFLPRLAWRDEGKIKTKNENMNYPKEATTKQWL